MRQFREPFSLETAEGFPVDAIRVASQSHVRRGPGTQKKTEGKKTGEKVRKNPDQGERA